MPRTVFLGGNPEVDGLVVAPNAVAARSLGVGVVTLEQLAVGVLPVGSVASFVVSRGLLMRAVRVVLGDVDAWGFARFYLPAVRELLRLNADLGVVGACGGRLAVLAEVAEVFKGLLAERGLVDASMVFFEAARGVIAQRVSVVGYPRLGLGELVFLDALAGDGSALVLPFAEDALFRENEEAAAFLEARGWRVECEPAARVWQVPAGTSALRFASQDAEVRGVLARVKALLDDGVRADDVTLVVRDEQLYGPLILGVAREYGIEVAAFYAVPLTNTLVGSFVMAFVRMLQDAFSYETTVRFLGHVLSEALERSVWAEVREKHPRRLAEWAALGITLPVLPAVASRGAFIRALEDVLGGVTVRLPRELSALKVLRDALESLDVNARVSQGVFLEELVEVLASLTVAVKPGRGVRVHTPLAVLGARLEHVFVLGLAEGVFPPALKDDSALDFFERKRLRTEGMMIETAPYAVWREQLSFYVLLAGVRGSLCLSFAEQLNGQLLEASYYFELLGFTPVTPEDVPVVSAQEQRSVSLLTRDGAGSHGFRVEQRREQSGLFAAFDGVTGQAVDVTNHVFSATQLSQLLSCPFKWFARYVLKVEQISEFEEDVLLRGNLYHKTLELLARNVLHETSVDVRTVMLDALDAAFVEAESRLGVTDVPAWQAKRLEFLSVLRRAIMARDFVLEGACVVAAEAPFEVDWQGFRVRGVIDRVDETPEALVITDYKTSGYVSEPDVQLLIYEAGLASQRADKRVMARYFNVRKAQAFTKRVPEDLGVRIARAKEVLASGLFAPQPDTKTCAYCEFAALCRKGAGLNRLGEGIARADSEAS